MRLFLAAVLLSAGLIAASTGQSTAEVSFDNSPGFTPSIYIYGEITKDDAESVAQQTADKNELMVNLNSVGGSVDAAMKIGRIIRKHEAGTVTGDDAKCLSSCALIYIAGVTRSNHGVIGLHRPFLGGAALSREAIERAIPLMLQKVKDYVREMGISDAFYDAMVNTEVSEVRLYRGDEIAMLVPATDPTSNEIQNSDDARKYGVSAGEMRRRKSVAWEVCPQIPFLDESRASRAKRVNKCIEAIYRGGGRPPELNQNGDRR